MVPPWTLWLAPINLESSLNGSCRVIKVPRLIYPLLDWKKSCTRNKSLSSINHDIETIKMDCYFIGAVIQCTAAWNNWALRSRYSHFTKAKNLSCMPHSSLLSATCVWWQCTHLTMIQCGHYIKDQFLILLWLKSQCPSGIIM